MSRLHPLVRHLIERRKGLGLTQTEIARRAGLSKTYINELEADGRRPSFDTVNAYAAAVGLRITFEYLAPHEPTTICTICRNPWPCGHATGPSEPAHIYKRTDEKPGGDRFACARYDEDGPLIAAALNSYVDPAFPPHLDDWNSPEDSAYDQEKP